MSYYTDKKKLRERSSLFSYKFESKKLGFNKTAEVHKRDLEENGENYKEAKRERKFLREKRLTTCECGSKKPRFQRHCLVCVRRIGKVLKKRAEKLANALTPEQRLALLKEKWGQYKK